MDSVRRRSWGRRLVVVLPYLWLPIFFLIPFLIVFKISLSQIAIAQPPYEPVLDLAAGFAGLQAFFAHLSFDNYATLVSDPLYFLSYLKSLEIAAISTVLLLLIGFPIGYGMTRLPRPVQPSIVMLVVLPFWTAFLIRIYAWINILQHDGVLNRALQGLGIIDEPLAWLSSDTAI